MDELKQIPILAIDIENYSERTNREERRFLMSIFERIAVEAGRFFMPFGDLWKKWKKQPVGDGFYFLFDCFTSQVALKYAFNLNEKLNEYNRLNLDDVPIRIRMVLVIGDVEYDGTQYQSDAFTEAARFLDHDNFKKFLQSTDESTVLSINSLFAAELRNDISQNGVELVPENIKWSSIQFEDKHDRCHKGYVLGNEGWVHKNSKKKIL